MGNGRLPGPMGLCDDEELLCRPRTPDEQVCRARPPGPMCGGQLASHPVLDTPGPLGVNDYAEECAEGGRGQPMPGSASGSNVEMLVVEAEAREPLPEGSVLELTAEALAMFVYDQRTNWPGAVQDLQTVVDHLREFGAAKFYVHKGKAKGKVGKVYLVFKGNPRKPGKFVGLREMIRGNGPYGFKNPAVVELGFGYKNALRAGARATFFSFVVVGAIDVVQELMQEEVSLVRLGVNLGVDTVKLLASFFAGAAVTGVLTTAAIGSLPVVAVAAAGLAVALGVGWGLDRLDEHFGVTQALQDLARQAQERAEWELAEVLRQLHWCIMNPHRCVPY